MPPAPDPRITRTPLRRRAPPSADVRITAVDPTLLPAAGIELRGPPPGTVAILVDAGMAWIFGLPVAAEGPPPLPTASVLRALWYEFARRSYTGADYHGYVAATQGQAVMLLAGGGGCLASCDERESPSP